MYTRTARATPPSLFFTSPPQCPRYLSFRDTRLSGTLPSAVGFLAHLRSLHLDMTGMSGTIPTEAIAELHALASHSFNDDPSNKKTFLTTTPAVSGVNVSGTADLQGLVPPPRSTGSAYIPTPVYRETYTYDFLSLFEYDDVNLKKYISQSIPQVSERF